MQIASETSGSQLVAVKTLRDQVQPARDVGGGVGGGRKKEMAAAHHPGMAIHHLTWPLSTLCPLQASEEEFRHEMSMMLKLRHPNLVSLLHVITKEQPLAVVLEFQRAGDFSDWQSRGQQGPR